MRNHTYRELLIGCGHKRDKRIDPRRFGAIRGTEEWDTTDQVRVGPKSWHGVVECLDVNPAVNPTMVWDLAKMPWCRRGDLTLEPIADDTYDEVHAYEVLEHLGQQGDYATFFAHFSEIWRILKPGGYLAATVPSRFDQWLWGDPGHTRVILPCTLVFLSQPVYDEQAGKTPMSDYRGLYRADFDILNSYDDQHTHQFVLQAVKPSRCSAQPFKGSHEQRNPAPANG
jgi:SAM-dependent methyltransferase